MEHRRLSAGDAPHEGPLKRKADISRVCPALGLAKLGLGQTWSGQTWSWPNLVWPNLVLAKLGNQAWPILDLAKLGLARRKRKENMTQFERVVTEKIDELAKARAMLDEGFMALVRADTLKQERERRCT